MKKLQFQVKYFNKVEKKNSTLFYSSASQFSVQMCNYPSYIMSRFLPEYVPLVISALLTMGHIFPVCPPLLHCPQRQRWMWQCMILKQTSPTPSNKEEETMEREQQRRKFNISPKQIMVVVVVKVHVMCRRWLRATVKEAEAGIDKPNGVQRYKSYTLHIHLVSFQCHWQ